MTRTPYTVLHLGYPTSGIVPTDQLKVASRHASALAAARAVRRYQAHLQPGEWDDHYYITGPDGEAIDASRVLTEDYWRREVAREMRKQRRKHG